MISTVPMLDAQADPFDALQRLAECLRNHDGSMPAAGAADRDGQVALAFRHVLWQRKLEKRSEVFQEIPGFGLAVHVARNGLVAAGQLAKPAHEVRIRQAAD